MKLLMTILSAYLLTIQGYSPKLACPSAGVITVGGVDCSVPQGIRLGAGGAPKQQYSVPGPQIFGLF